MTEYIEPELLRDDFHCPHCGVYAHQHWYKSIRLYKSSFEGMPVGASSSLPSRYTIASCQRCENITFWDGDTMVYPWVVAGPEPNPDMPGDVLADYQEARSVLQVSPRASAALLRLALQKLCVALGQPGRNLDDDVAALVQTGLPSELARVLDIVRVVGNNAVHPGQMDLSDDRQTAIQLFGLVNIIVERMIVQPKAIQKLYGRLPQGARDHIAKRDTKADR